MVRIQLILVVAVLLIGTALISIVGIASAGQQSVSLSGHTFTADLPDGWTTDTATESTDTYGPRWGAGEYYPLMNNNWIGWTGQVMPNAFVSNDKSSGIVAIYLLKVPSDEYYSNSTEKEILENASFLANGYILKDYIKNNGVSVKDITFNGYSARLLEEDMFADVSFELDKTTVAIIDVDWHDGKPWDIINSITVA
jgi:hypothetical protein